MRMCTNDIQSLAEFLLKIKKKALMDFCIRRWALSVIFCSKSLHGFTAVIRSAMSINKIFIQSRYIFEMFLVVDICVQLHSVWFSTRCGRLRNRDRKKVLSTPINLDFLRQGEFRSRKGFSQLSRDTTAVAVVDYDHESHRQAFKFQCNLVIYFPIFIHMYKRELHILTLNHRFLQRLYQSGTIITF